MAIKLKQVLDGNEGQQELSMILHNTKEEIRADVRVKQSRAKLKILERELNRTFYPVGKTAISTDYYSQRLAQSTEQELIKVFEKFDFENYKQGLYSQKSSMAPETLRRVLNTTSESLKQVMKRLENSPSYTSEENIKKIKKEAEDLIEKGILILEGADTEYKMVFGKKHLGGKSFEDAALIVNQLSAFADALSIPDFVSPQEAGILFEQALALTNFVDDSSEAVIDDIMRELSSKTVFGSESIKRGHGGLIQYEVDTNLLKRKDKQNKFFKVNKGNATYTYTYNPSEAKQGKMDVQLKYNSPFEHNYRVSAKRWSKGHGDLGETSIDAGISRAAGIGVAEAYKYAVLTPRKDWKDGLVPQYQAAKKAHEFAIMALKSDIAMGLNQGVTESGAGYANVLVVDTGERIIVRDLASIVLDENQKLSRYNSSEIQSIANSIYRSMNQIKQGRSSSYLGMMTSTLNKMKVTINLNTNK